MTAESHGTKMPVSQSVSQSVSLRFLVLTFLVILFSMAATKPLSFDDRQEAKNQKFYITTAIAYLNGAPHLGHAYEFITADVCSRYHTVAGRKSLYSTGADEYGQKVSNAAAREGITPQALCDRLVARFKDLNAVSNLSAHEYSRTTAASHHRFVQWLWRRAREAGEIYLGTYAGWYNVREENFVTERDAAAANYLDEQSQRPLEKRDEECYFFKMSKYHDRIYQLIKNTDFLQPEARRNELLARLEASPLEDLCVSRRTLKWGVPVPDDDQGHVVYVWFDALSNYMSILGYPEGDKSDFWPADVHIIGKDITWFHCVIWPSILMATNLPLPAKVFGHGFVNATDGNKMSKSIGNVVDPFSCIEQSSSDSFRWYLVREGRYGTDLRFSMGALVDMHNADLVSTIGNLVHRGIALCMKNCDGMVPEDREEQSVNALINYPAVYNRAEEAMGSYALEEIASIGLEICRNTNKYLTDTAPWTIKDNLKAKRAIIHVVLDAVYIAAHFLQPIIPIASDKIFQRLGQPSKTLADLASDGWNLVPGTKITPGEVLFTPLTNETLTAESSQPGATSSGPAGSATSAASNTKKNL